MLRTLCFIALILLNCNSSVPVPNDTIIVGIDKGTDQFDPRLPTDSTSQKINRLIYSGLLKKNEKLELVPDLAESFTLQNSTTYIFKIRQGITFHNQQKLTSADIKATYLSMMGDKIKSPFKGSLSIIQNIETPDPYSIIFHLKKANSPFLTLMSLGILPASLAKKADLAGDFIGTGPYQLLYSQLTLNSILLERFNSYYDQKAKTKFIKFRVIQDATLRTLELIKGRIEILQNSVPYVLVDRLQKEAHLKYQKSPGINFSYMAFNFKNPHLKKLKVRKAIALSIDRQKIIRYKLAQLGTLADSLLSPGHWAYNSSLKAYSYNLEEARKLLDEAGFLDPDGDGPQSRFELIYKTSSVKERVEIAQLIAEDLARIGIKVHVKSYEFGTFYRDIRQGDFDLYTLTWVGLTDPDIYYYVFHSLMFAPKGANRGFYKNESLDALLDQSRQETDHKKLVDLYRKIQEIVYNDFVYAPLWYENNFVFMPSFIKGYQARADASYVNLVNAYK